MYDRIRIEGIQGLEITTTTTRIGNRSAIQVCFLYTEWSVKSKYI